MKNKEISASIGCYLSFNLENELFAFQVNNVKSIIEVTRITKIPQSPDYMKGVINFRGKALPVVDLRAKLNLPPIQFTSNTCILVTEIMVKNDIELIGVLTDSVQEVIEFNEDQLLPPPSIAERRNAEFIKGIAHTGTEFIVVIDPKQLFYESEFRNLKETIESENQ